jgi:hypothetical protein
MPLVPVLELAIYLRLWPRTELFNLVNVHKLGRCNFQRSIVWALAADAEFLDQSEIFFPALGSDVL